MPNSVDLTTEKNRCLHCKKDVVASIECLKCGGYFHPACMAQANEAKSKHCLHVDLKGLVKEYEAQNKIIQKLLSKITKLEDNVSKNSEISTINTAKIMELTAKVETLENELQQYRVNNLSETRPDLPSSAGEESFRDLESIGSILNKELKNHSEILADKMNNVAKAILSSNKELVRFLTHNATLNHGPSLNADQREQGYSEVIPQTEDSSKLSSSNLARTSSLSTNPGGVIRGTSEGTLRISAACEQKWFYVGNLTRECTDEQIKNHLIENNISVLSCEKLDRNDHRASFKISVTPQQETAILNSKIWPLNVIVKPFVFRRSGLRTNGSRQNFRRGYRSQNRFRQDRQM